MNRRNLLVMFPFPEGRRMYFTVFNNQELRVTSISLPEMLVIRTSRKHASETSLKAGPGRA